MLVTVECLAVWSLLLYGLHWHLADALTPDRFSHQSCQVPYVSWDDSRDTDLLCQHAATGPHWCCWFWCICESERAITVFQIFHDWEFWADLKFHRCLCSVKWIFFFFGGRDSFSLGQQQTNALHCLLTPSHPQWNIETQFHCLDSRMYFFMYFVKV